ncbi:glycine oxidase ThiO [Marinagarivorans cellulosilyticus]|uniref:D-amino-acid oxidase n=1 Tax=Marinagarivorans cellulosilyticus TaxID=2721545 RepID=A0AAN2BL84_9GAMM|nr:glycine oxidase ThiO [Marinagarivorans cellulosilyticus]BCD98868.1 glycine oxidase [Marinagarivorans cellulosilyticus]
MPTPSSFAIAGAGLAGSLLAWRLLETANRPIRVTLFEKGDLSQPRSAAYTAAAMISPLSEVVVSERAIYDMGMHSLQLWPKWLSTLNQHSAKPVLYNNQGSLVVAHPSDESELEQFAQDLRYHLGDSNTAQWLNRNELTTYEPDLNPHFNRGLLLPDEAFLDNRQLLHNLHQRIIALGGSIQDNTSITFTPEPQREGRPLAGYDCTIDARGTGAKQSQAVRGVRGEVLWVQTPEVTLKHAVRLMHPRYKLYIVPKPNNSFIVGATEIESQDSSPVSVQSMMELCSALYTLNPAFAEARIIELDANLRPSYMDNMPAITWHKSGNSVSINGLYRHGYLLAPHLIENLLGQLS